MPITADHIACLLREPLAPSVHLNGTGVSDLLEQQQAVLDAIAALDEALRRATPNGRDYYPQGPDAFTRALADHGAERAVLRALAVRHETLALGLAECLTTEMARRHA